MNFTRNLSSHVHTYGLNSPRTVWSAGIQATWLKAVGWSAEYLKQRTNHFVDRRVCRYAHSFIALIKIQIQNGECTYQNIKSLSHCTTDNIQVSCNFQIPIKILKYEACNITGTQFLGDIDAINTSTYLENGS